MSKDLVISATRHETRVALLEDDQLVEIYHQRENEYSLAGSIHKGRVTRVLPGMQSAFVDIGLDRDAFLYVSDFFEDNEEYDKIVTSVEDQVLKLGKGTQPVAAPVQSPVPGAIPSAVQSPIPSAVTSNDAPAPAAVILPASPATEGIAPGGAAAPSTPHHEQRRDEHDRRGRRSRRRRGGRGRGLPDSKFYSPDQRGDDRTEKDAGAESSEEAAPPAPEPVAPYTPRAAAEPPDDFFVLPGESLAKYAGPDEDREPEVETNSTPAAERLDAVAARLVEALEAENAPEPPAPAAAAASQTPVLASEAVSPVESVAEALSAAVEPEESAEETADAESAEPENAAADEETVGADESASAEEQFAPEDVDAAEAEPPIESPDAVAEPEGPEPARIPTSLTATLREQGPRYLHRVSRRMRRRGGRDRGDRGPQPATAEPVSRPAPEPEVRTAPAKTAPPDTRAERPGASISDLLKEGQEIIVQIAKEPLGQKGARITSHIALPGRFLVYMPTVDHVGVSRKIPSDEERSRLKRILQSNRTGIPGGYIVRTAGEGRSEEELRADMMFLYNLWLDMRQKAERKPAPMLIHHDLNVVERVLRDQLTSSFKNIWVDNEELYEGVLRFVERFQPALVSRVKLYTRANPIFDEFGITSELEKALRPKVWLKSGGYIVINQTEALVAIDINTGKYVGRSNRLEDTIVKTNTDAIKEIVRQIRLRDLGGIIVVDFIDMDERKNRQKVMQALEEAMRVDRAPYKILQFNDFGLVAITRKRVKQSLERTLCVPCAFCDGAGYVKSPQTIVTEILQEARKLAGAIESKDVLLRVSPDVARLLKSNQNTYLQELEETLGRPVFVKGDSTLHQEKFDLA
ncbi:MAG: Rne/Rng family ribonuclease [Bryobacteraceae bacterium]